MTIICCIAAFYFSPVQAATTKAQFEQTESALTESKAKQAEISKRLKDVQEQYQDLQNQMVDTAKSMQVVEHDLSDSEEKLRIINEQSEHKNTELKKHQQQLSAMLDASIRLSQTPPEAAVLMPGDFGQVMKAARALSLVSDQIKEQQKSVSAQLAELTELKTKAERQQAAIRERQDKLDDQRESLNKKLVARKALQAELNQTQSQEAKKTAALAKESSDLKDLMTKLEKHHTLAEEEKKEAKVIAPPSTRKRVEKITGRSQMRSFARARGHIRVPVAGHLDREFGVSDGRNETSRGITIATRDRAQVTAPYDGEVVFTGPFLNYGKLVILRHSDDYHTLVAGLSKIDVSVGQFLLEGEPIGAMGESGAGNRLYVELRKDNQPIDPASWMAGL